jgi:hypothetical protein
VLNVKRRATTQQSVRIDYVCHGVGRVELRRFDPARDSYVALTALLHRAFTPLGAMGLNCTCVDQTVETTRLRATRGDCYVAACNGRIVGTMTLYAPDRESACELYRRDDIASLRQFAVEPVWQARASLQSWPRLRPPARALTACEIRIERIISRWSLRTR